MAIIEQTLAHIRPVSSEWRMKAEERLDSLTKPKGSLGRLEELAARVVAVREEERPSLEKREVFVFVGDHGVVSDGVSAYPQEVTALMVNNFLSGGAAINVLARSVGAEVSVIDVGMKERLAGAEGLIDRNVRRGTGNIAVERAMELSEARSALEAGIEMASRAHAEGMAMVATGEMGIGNTTPSAALLSVLLPADIKAVTGKGTGLDDEGVRHKIQVIEKAVSVNKPASNDPLGALAALGGLEIAGICGLCLGGAAHRMLVVVDGFISTAGKVRALHWPCR